MKTNKAGDTLKQVETIAINCIHAHFVRVYVCTNILQEEQKDLSLVLRAFSS